METEKPKKKKKMKFVKRPVFTKQLVVSIRFEESVYRLVQEIAEIETKYSYRVVTANDLIRNAVKFVYLDGERLRETFRRARWDANYKKKFGLKRKKR